MPGGGTKLVANAKVATGNTIVAAAFWDGLAQKTDSATVGQVYRIDRGILKPEGGGKYSLGSTTATTALPVSDQLADAGSVVSMSPTYGASYEDTMKKAPSKGALYELENIAGMQLSTTGVLLVPAVYLRDARGMTAEMPSGCMHCKNYLESVGITLQCPEHGENKRRNPYGGQLMLADPSHKKELAVLGRRCGA